MEAMVILKSKCLFKKKKGEGGRKSSENNPVSPNLDIMCVLWTPG